jgi:hypothetical protein
VMLLSSARAQANPVAVPGIQFLQEIADGFQRNCSQRLNGS